MTIFSLSAFAQNIDLMPGLYKVSSKIIADGKPMDQSAEFKKMMEQQSKAMTPEMIKQMKSEHLKHVIELNIAVLLVSTSGLLGRYISMPPPVPAKEKVVLSNWLVLSRFPFSNKYTDAAGLKLEFHSYTLTPQLSIK